MRGLRDFRWSALNCPPSSNPTAKEERSGDFRGALEKLWRLNSSVAPWGLKDGGTKGLEMVQR